MVKAAKNYVCERCKREMAFIQECGYCSRKICRACEKSSATHSKTSRTAICKGCWTDLRKRTRYKSA